MAIQRPTKTAAPADATSVSSPVQRRTAPNPNGGPVKFNRAVASATRRMIISVCGEEKSGKNHFGFTFPDPIYLHSFDVGLEGVVDQFIKQKEIYVAEYSLEVQPGMAAPDVVADAADKVWNNFTSNYKDSLVSAKTGTVILDTDTEVYELLRLSRFGKLTQVMPHHYGPINVEFRDIIRSAYDHKCNLYLIGRVGDEWLNDASGKGQKTGRRIRKGFGDLEYLTQVNAVCERLDTEGGGSTFNVHIDSCRFNPAVNGVDLPNNYEEISGIIFP